MIIQPAYRNSISGKWQPHWGGEDISATCASGEFKIKVRDDVKTAFTVTQPTAGNTYEVFVDGVSQGTFNRNTSYTFAPTLGAGCADLYNNGYTTYNITIKAVVGSISQIEVAIPTGYISINQPQGYLWIVNNISGLIFSNISGARCYIYCENVEFKASTVTNSVQFIDFNNLIKLSGTISYSNSRSNYINCTKLTEFTANFDKSKNDYTQTFYNCFLLDMASIINGTYTSSSASYFGGFIGNCHTLSGLDITADKMVDFSNNSWCIKSTYCYIRSSNFKSIVAAGTKIVLQYWVSMNETAWLNFVTALESLVGYTSHTIDIRNNPGVTAAVVTALQEKNWTVLS